MLETNLLPPRLSFSGAGEYRHHQIRLSAPTLFCILVAQQPRTKEQWILQLSWESPVFWVGCNRMVRKGRVHFKALCLFENESSIEFRARLEVKCSRINDRTIIKSNWLLGVCFGASVASWIIKSKYTLEESRTCRLGIVTIQIPVAGSTNATLKISAAILGRPGQKKSTPLHWTKLFFYIKSNWSRWSPTLYGVLVFVRC